MPEIILVDIGLFQSHIYDCIKQLQLFHHTITVITDKHLLDHFSKVEGIQVFRTDLLDIGEFNKKNQLDASYRDGFNTYCSKRLFYIHAYMKQYNKKGCIHIENDIMVYHTFETFIPEPDKVWLTMSHENICTPGILYIPDSTTFGHLIDSYDYTKNDMENLAIFFNTHRNLCRPFPIILNNTFYKENTIYKKYYGLYNGIFDAGAIGQYLGGVDLNGYYSGGIDPQNTEGDTRGFISNLCSVSYYNYKFMWKKKLNGLYTPFLMVDYKQIPIFNLHIHSKDLSKFMSTYPKEDKFCNRTDTFEYFEKNIVPVPNIVCAGRLCNNSIVCLAVSILAEKHNLAIEYEWQAKIEALGIQLFKTGTKRYTTCIELTDHNYPDLFNSTTLNSTIHLDSLMYLQTTFITTLLYKYIRNESQLNNIVLHNTFKDRYKTNNDCFIHIRLGDIEAFNPGLEYYRLALSKLSFTTLYIATDSPDHSIVTSVLKLYPLAKILECDEFDTIHFGSTCKYVVLSHGSFSAFIGYMAFFSEIYYPFFEKVGIWHGTIFSIPGWNMIEY